MRFALQPPVVSEATAKVPPFAGGAVFAALPSVFAGSCQVFLSLSGSVFPVAIGGMAGMTASAAGSGGAVCPSTSAGGAVMFFVYGCAGCWVWVLLCPSTSAAGAVTVGAVSAMRAGAGGPPAPLRCMVCLACLARRGCLARLANLAVAVLTLFPPGWNDRFHLWRYSGMLLGRLRRPVVPPRSMRLGSGLSGLLGSCFWSFLPRSGSSCGCFRCPSVLFILRLPGFLGDCGFADVDGGFGS